MITADRVRADSHVTLFERLKDSNWDVVLELPTPSVQGIQRRLTELDGRWIWRAEQPMPAVGLRFRPGAQPV